MGVLKLLLDARGLSKPTGLPLFTYRLTDAECSTIRKTLCKCPDENQTEWGALFCLFAAEHIRRNYEGGPWKWEPIRDSIGYKFGLQPLYLRIERGLNYLERPLQKARCGDRQFWLTLMCEGGIPIHVLKRDGAPVTRFLRALLTEVERYPTLAVRDAAERAARLHLTSSLQNDAFLSFATHLIEVVRDLRAKISSRQNTIEELDAGQPGWRNRIPVAVDDDSARRLLEGLLTTPRQEAEPWNGLGLDTLLLLKEQPALHRHVRPVVEIPVGDVAKMLGLGATQTAPSRLVVHLVRNENELASVGVLTQRSGAGYSFRPSSAGVEIDAPERLTPAVFTQGSHQLGTIAIPGSEALGDGVWVFSPVTDDTARLVAVGSYRAATERLIVAIPSGATWMLEQGDERTLGNLFGRLLVEVRGKAVCTSDGVRSVVDTRESTKGRAFRLEGKLRPSLFLNREVFTGFPEVVETFADGSERVVPRAQLELRFVGGTRRPILYSPSIFGDLQIRVVENGEAVFATRCGVVPSDFRMALVPSDQDGVGRITVASCALRMVTVEQSASHKCSASGHDGKVHYVELNGMPSPVGLRLQFEGDGVLHGTTPFPARFTAFTDRLGKPISPNARLSVRALAGLSARCIAPANKMPKEIDLEARLETGSAEYVGRLVERLGLGKVLDLETVRDRLELLLSSSEGNEDVRLTLAERGGLVGATRHITLRRYDACLMPEKLGDHELLALHTMENAFGDFGSLDVCAVPLWRPLAPPERLQRTDDGRWIFPYEGHEPGPWLVTGWLGDAMSVRPLRVTVPGTLTEPCASRLQEIVRTPFGRDELFGSLFQEMSSSWSHPEWSGADEFLSTLGVFPSYTFEAVRALVMHPAAAIVALLRTNDPITLTRRWRFFEELPMSWFMLPLRAWLLAGVTLREEASRCVDSNGGACNWSAARFVIELLAPLETSPLPQFVTCIREMWCCVMPDFPVVPSGLLKAMSAGSGREMVADAVIRPRTEELAARHANDHWPQVRLDLPVDSDRRVEALVRKLWPNQLGFRLDALRTPIVAAALMVDNHAHIAPELVRAARRIRAFDEEWFDEIHALALVWFVGEQLEKDNAYLDKAAGL